MAGLVQKMRMFGRLWTAKEWKRDEDGGDWLWSPRLRRALGEAKSMPQV